MGFNLFPQHIHCIVKGLVRRSITAAHCALQYIQHAAMTYAVVLRVAGDSSTHAKVTNLDIFFIYHKHIASCQVPVDKPHLLQVLHALWRSKDTEERHAKSTACIHTHLSYLQHHVHNLDVMEIAAWWKPWVYVFHNRVQGILTGVSVETY